MKPLSMLAVGERGVVSSVVGDAGIRRRLRAMGFVAGTLVSVKRCAPMGDPVAYDLMGYCLSLRKDEAALVMVEPVPRMNLLSAPVGVRLRVLEVAGGWGMRRRLATLGLAEGGFVVKTGGAGSGPVEVEVEGRRGTIGHGMAHRVAVAPAETAEA
jgi:ferrous iron transport protein A